MNFGKAICMNLALMLVLVPVHISIESDNHWAVGGVFGLWGAIAGTAIRWGLDREPRR
jgi:hypothetical protein